MTSKRTNWSTYAYAAWTILVGFVGAPLTIAGGALAWSAATPIGRAVGIGSMMLAVALQPITWRRRILGAMFAVAAFSCVAYVVAARSSASLDAPGAVAVVGRRPSPWSPMTIVPEIDQLFLVSNAMQWFSRESADDMTELRADIGSVYGEFDAAFVSVPSLLDDAFGDECSGRAFVWPPAESALPSATAPAHRSLVFVHGYGGSWTGYLRVLHPVSDAIGATLVQPSCGVGRYTTERDVDAFERLLTDGAASSVEDSEIHLVAHANAGLAVSRRIATVIGRAKSLVLISPAFDLAALASAERAEHPIPVLVIHGDADDRVPMEHVRAGAERLRRLHLDVRVHVLEGADRFAIFHDREAIRRELEAFYGELEPPRAR